MSDKTPEEIAAEAGEKGTFSFLERLKGRSYGKDDIVVNLDEELGYLLVKLQNTLADTPELDADRIGVLEEKIDQVKAQLHNSEYTFHMEGFSNERYDELANIAKEAHPIKYDTITSPITGQKSRQVVPNEQRDEMFSRLVWKEAIKRVVAPDGSVDENIDDEFIDALLKNAPQAALNRIAQTVEKLRVASDWIEATQDEDFLAKP